jgi:hypothetical protein
VRGFADDYTADKQFCPSDLGTEGNAKHELETEQNENDRF